MRLVVAQAGVEKGGIDPRLVQRADLASISAISGETTMATPRPCCWRTMAGTQHRLLPPPVGGEHQRVATTDHMEGDGFLRANERLRSQRLLSGRNARQTKDLLSLIDSSNAYG